MYTGFVRAVRNNHRNNRSRECLFSESHSITFNKPHAHEFHVKISGIITIRESVIVAGRHLLNSCRHILKSRYNSSSQALRYDAFLQAHSEVVIVILMSPEPGMGRLTIRRSRDNLAC
jgi:hypothetical protein